MLFNTLQFLIFFPIVVCLYFAVLYRLRWALLLAASYYFYMCWKAEYLILILASTLIDYIAGLCMGRHTERAPRRKYLILSLAVNLGLLFSFKYWNFFSASLRATLEGLNIFYDVPSFDILLPVGISFYTFQTLSYTIDVYRGDKKPEKHLGIFALYVAFFPQLVAGPIERSTHLLPQFWKKHDFDYQRVRSGLLLMLWGLFKKIVIADRLAVYVNHVYNSPGDFTGAPMILATYFFTFQIYCDFSGYSDIAIGAARVMGFDLMTNFNRPYFATSIRDFWKRWHISLTTWFRDYLYIPLGGNRAGRWRWFFNLYIVFLLSGLWHGANWTFLVWGALHGLYLIFAILTSDLRKRLARLFNMNRFPKLLHMLQVIITFHLVLLAWVFFRANTLADAILILRRMFIIDPANLNINVTLGTRGIAIAVLSIVIMQLVHWFGERCDLRQWFDAKPLLVRWAVYILLAFSIMNLGAVDEIPFIYFQF
jgi:alginate O-acetyltransferase complex protein AlgI